MQTLWLRVFPNKATKTNREKREHVQEGRLRPGGVGAQGKLSQGHMRHGCHGSFSPAISSLGLNAIL